MKLARWIQRSVPFAGAGLVALAASAAPALAQFGRYNQGGQTGQELFEWNGRVDREIQLVMRGNNVQVERIGSTEPRGGRPRMLGTLPPSDGQVVLQLLQGRGNVNVIQQPSRQNGYTAIVRIEDAQSGADTYRIAAYWQGYANGNYSNGNYSNGDVYTNPNGRVNRARSRGRDRDRDRDRDGDDDDRRGGYNDGRYNNNGQYNPNGVYNGNAGSGRYGNAQSANTALHWSGNVDDELEIRIQNGQIGYRTIRGNQPMNIRAELGNLNMPRNAANVMVVQNQGRGTVSVVQQPSSWNGYTTVIRIRDPQGGYGFYDFNLMWQ